MNIIIKVVFTFQNQTKLIWKKYKINSCKIEKPI